MSYRAFAEAVYNKFDCLEYFPPTPSVKPKHESASVSLHYREFTYPDFIVSRSMHLWSFRAERPRHGHGKYLLDVICELADMHRVALTLTAGALNWIIPQEELVKFYMSRGFINLEKRIEPYCRMLRIPPLTH